MQTTQKKARRLLAVWLTMMLLVTGLLPIGIVSAAPTTSVGNWSAIANPTAVVINNPAELNSFGSSADPVEVNARVIGNTGAGYPGIKLTYKDASQNGNEIDITVNGTPISTTGITIDASQTVELPAITLNADGTVTKVTVKPRGSAASADIAEMYYRYIPSPTGALKFTDATKTEVTVGSSVSNPEVSPTRTLSGLYATYTKPWDKNATIEVRLNGTLIQTISGSSVNIDGTTAMSLASIDLATGINAIQIYAPNTGESDVIYYKYGSADSALTISGFPGQGDTAYTPVLYGESKITLTGTFGGGIVGSNLRIKLITNNGQTVEDLSNTAPTINGTTFTFADISLKPGLNQIAFYERIGNVTKEHRQFYVQYNNTPLVSNLMIDDTPLAESSSQVTYVTVPSPNRLTLNLGGTAKNAEIIEVTNTTIGETVRTEVSRTGAFGVNVPSRLGENTLQIRAFNSDKEVGVIQRKILVATNDSGSADQFYKAAIGSVPLVPNETVKYAANGNTNPDVVLSGTALLRYVDISGTQQFDKFKLTIKEVGSTATPLELELTAAEFTKLGTPQANFTEYSIAANIPANTFSHNKTYLATLSYQYFTKGSSGNLDVESGYIDINNYPYQFTYEDNTKPRFISVVNSVTGLPLTNGRNTVVTSPLNMKFTVENFTDLSVLKVKYNGATLSVGTDYVLGTLDDIASTPALTDKTFDLKLNKLPAGVGTLTVEYDNTDKATVNYTLDIQITPYVQLTYVDGTGQVKTFEDGYQIKNDNDIRTLDGKVYNYVLSTSNIEVTLNNNPITGLNINAPNGTFQIPKAKLNYQKGNNVLKIKLTDDPAVTFTYNVTYNTSKTPEISDIELEVRQNDNDVELEKKATDTAYTTSSFYLSKFSFNVQNATRVYVEKNGKRIIDYRYDSGDWDLETNHQEYQEAYQEAVIDDDLKTYFEDNNFEGKSKTVFEAEMTSSEYGNLVEDVQDNVTDADEQENLLALFPMTLKKSGRTTYTIVAEDDNGTVVRYDVYIEQQSNSWTVLSPVKEKETDPYVIVNSNSVPIKIFAENATGVLFGKTEATVSNTTKPDFYYDNDLGRTIPETYYVFTATVSLKKGLNTIKYTVKVGDASYNDEIKIYNANSAVNGAEYRDTLGKKLSFSVFDKALELKFPSGTVLLSPSEEQASDEIMRPSEDIFIDTPIYFGIADRTTGAVTIEDDDLESRLTLESNFNYASPLYYIDAGDVNAPFGRDPYFEEGDDVETFENRWEDNLVPSKKGTLSIQYDPSIVNAANNILTVFYHDGDEWHNLGGVVNTGKKVITVPFEGFGYYMVMKTRESYDDVVHHDYAREDMETLYAKGIMPAFSGSTFGANRDITRGEFATMLVKALDLPINAGPYRDSNKRDPLEPTFSDVRPSRDTWDYQYEYIETAARAGIIRGAEPGYFRPDNSLTREEAAVMIARALNLKLTGSVDAAKANLVKMFTDGKDVNYYAIPSVLAVTKAKLMNGEPNDPTAKKPTYRFLPKNNMTRAEMAVITVRVMVQLKKLPKQ